MLRHIARIFTLLGGVGLATAGLGADLTCPQHPQITVNAPSAKLSLHVCDIIADQTPALAACGLSQTLPIRFTVSSIEASQELRCLGRYHCASNEITLIHPDYLAAHPEAMEIYVGLSPQAVFDSLVTHELAHAYFEQTVAGQQIGVSAHEYVAYALQLRALDPTDRERFLSLHKSTSPPSLEMLNQVIMLFAPGVFAANVWRHFEQPQNGCAFVGELIDGTISLELPAL